MMEGIVEILCPKEAKNANSKEMAIIRELTLLMRHGILSDNTALHREPASFQKALS